MQNEEQELHIRSADKKFDNVVQGTIQNEEEMDVLSPVQKEQKDPFDIERLNARLLGKKDKTSGEADKKKRDRRQDAISDNEKRNNRNKKRKHQNPSAIDKAKQTIRDVEQIVELLDNSHVQDEHDASAELLKTDVIAATYAMEKTANITSKSVKAVKHVVVKRKEKKTDKRDAKEQKANKRPDMRYHSDVFDDSFLSKISCNDIRYQEKKPIEEEMKRLGIRDASGSYTEGKGASFKKYEETMHMHYKKKDSKKETMRNGKDSVVIRKKSQDKGKDGSVTDKIKKAAQYGSKAMKILENEEDPDGRKTTAGLQAVAVFIPKKILQKTGKFIWKKLIFPILLFFLHVIMYIILMILLVIFLMFLMLLPLILTAVMALSIVGFLFGNTNLSEDITAKDTYISHVYQMQETELQKTIQTAIDHGKTVTYISTISEESSENQFQSVYMAKITGGDIESITEENAIDYILIDTDEEKKTFATVYQQMNYCEETENVITVYRLNIQQWMEKNELTDKEKEFLEQYR